jgi:GMP synthase-like glutamine amidotransferase
VRPLLLVKNDPLETFGLAPSEFADAGAPFSEVDAHAGEAFPELQEISGVVMFGGSMNVDQVGEFPFLSDVRGLTRRAVDAGIPFLGICLGGQILARALGHAVPKAPLREIGFEAVSVTAAGQSDPLASSFTTGDRVFHWHEDMVELPEGATLLATSEHVPVQAYRAGEVAWGFQFHFEIDRPEIDLWLDDADGPDLEGTWGKSAARVRAEAEELLPAQETKGRRAFRRFAGIAQAREGMREDAPRAAGGRT